MVPGATPTQNANAEDSDDDLYLTWPPAGRNDIVEVLRTSYNEANLLTNCSQDYIQTPSQHLEEDHQDPAVLSSSSASDMPEENANPQVTSLDLAASLQGFYRILDLISEQGSGGTGMLDMKLLQLCHSSSL